jgi:hypothetical protein
MAILVKKVPLLLMVLAVLMLIVSLPEVTSAAPKEESSKATDPAKSTTADYAKGKGTIPVPGGGRFKFNAKSTRSGTLSNPAKGKFYVVQGGEFIKGKIECLVVENVDTGGAVANIGGTITKSNMGAEGQFANANVFDSGQPKGAGDTANVEVGGPKTCQSPTIVSDPISSGNIVVRTTTTAPSTT